MENNSVSVFVQETENSANKLPLTGLRKPRFC